jgi:hypothetical protein
VSVDLSDTQYATRFLNYINGPGATTFAPSETEIVGRLVSGFWQLRMSGADWMAVWTCSEDGLITQQTNAVMDFTTRGVIPISWYTDTQGAINPGQEIIEAICLYAARQAVVANLLSVQSQLSVKAGNVSYEAVQSATLLRDVLQTINDQIMIVIRRLTDLGFTDVKVLDAVMLNTQSILDGSSEWVSGGWPSMGGAYRGNTGGGSYGGY